MSMSSQQQLDLACTELDGTLRLLASHLLQDHFTPSQDDNDDSGGAAAVAAHTTTTTSLFKTAFALLPETGSSSSSNSGDYPLLEVYLPHSIAAAATTTLYSSTATTTAATTEGCEEVAIGVRGKALVAALEHHLQPLLLEGKGEGEKESIFPVSFDMPIGSHHATNNAKAASVPAQPQSVVLTPELLARPGYFTPGLVRLALAVLPAHEGLWNYRRLHLAALLERGSANSSTAIDCGGRESGLVLACLEELVWLNFLATLYHKLQPLYVYRGWIVRTLLASGALTRRPSPPPTTTAPLTVGRFARRYQEFDWVGCFWYAAEKHPLNYNGWHYRRCVLAAFFRAHTGQQQEKQRAHVDDFRPAYLKREFDETVQFLLVNNSDSSAAAYLLHLIEAGCALHTEQAWDASSGQQQQRQDPFAAGGPWEMGSITGRFARQAYVATSGDGGGGVGPSAATTRAVADEVHPQRLWADAFALTQRQLRVHADKGHECFFFLRLGLIRLALAHNSSSAVIIHSGWTVADELSWASVLADGPPSPSAASLPTAQLLEPTPPLRAAWVQCSGNYGFTAFLAAQYALQVIALVRPRAHGSDCVRSPSSSS